MVLPVFGYFFGEWLSKVWNGEYRSENMSSNVFMTDYTVSDEMFKVIQEFEAFVPNAYVVQGESFYTIGYGSTRIFSQDGKTSRPVKKGDKLTKEQAIFQMKMYYLRPGSVKYALDKKIRESGVRLHQRFYDMLCQIAYGSGSFHISSNFKELLNKANGVTSLPELASLLLTYYIGYLKSIHSKKTMDFIYFPNSKRKSNKGGYGLGWSRRAYGITQYIMGKDYTFKTAYEKIKKPY